MQRKAPKYLSRIDDWKSLNKNALDLWSDITPLARWDWIRWINGTKNPDTRKIRIDKTRKKIKIGTKFSLFFIGSL